VAPWPPRNNAAAPAASAASKGRDEEPARELVEFARKHGYRRDDLVEIIESVS
jgi:hypothetical protein